MIGEILPPAVAWAEAYHDETDAELPPEEEAVIARAVDARRRAFATGRACARRALAGLGMDPAPIPRGERGAPQWPTGVVGSITHCDGYRAAAVARDRDVAAIGIDAEPNGALPAGVLSRIATGDELPLVRELSTSDARVSWDRLVFCAKEAVYKAWFPLARARLGFEDADVVSIRLGARSKHGCSCPGRWSAVGGSTGSRGGGWPGTACW